jgi:hypothetical protein
MKFDQKSAIDGSNFGSSYIDESGNYDGKIITAHRVITGEYTRINIVFENTDGQTAKVKIPIFGPNGQMFGRDIIQSAMGLLRISEITYIPDGQNGDKIPDLCGKPISVSIQKELYINAEGKEKWSLHLLRFFHPQTHKSFSETIKNCEAKAWTKVPTDKDKRSKVADTSFNFGANVTSPRNDPQLDSMFGSLSQESLPWESKK